MVRSTRPLARWRYLAAFAAWAAWAPVAHADMVVVVGAASPIKTLTREQIFNLYLGRQSSLPGIETVTPVDLPAGQAVRVEFYRLYLGKTPSQANAYWAKMIFSGKGQPPRELADGKALKRALAEHPDYLGYLERSDADPSVRIIAIP